ncbi:geranylgeranyl transferase type II beta subunit, putative [Theileria equi strain WA]|uniref:Geranylgeranyl transferase type II subunit beta n=1 Tax=Theileria equi strain WA TaxID=1537102 RepID=L0AY11_THEEQ|nr:geranylgeranyl transferase type II beta subunit, putative [Theileria equi strain WA]AFZ80440.1 geranylgeranyl transferase type II beta subunit, putative [Theileria equi strain WA]|eukprot:XP_004830106.1 geranylgeranyl transferase type II beta subunit, putative [Theileria equi strain WA]
MDRLSEYFRKFTSFGVSVLCKDDGPSSIGMHYEKSFICGSFWSICGLKILSGENIPDECLAKILAKLKRCLTVVNSRSKSTEISTAKGFRQYDNEEFYTANIQSTLYAVQIYHLLEKTGTDENEMIRDLIIQDSDLESILMFIKLLWNDKAGFFYNSLNYKSSHDLRHTMSSLCTFVLTNELLRIERNEILEKMQEFVNFDLFFKFIKSHFNQDGGVSLVPGGQSHAAAAFCLIGIFILIDRLHKISKIRIQLLVTWLLGRISVSGGVSGRVGKSNDICYIWWSLATLMLIQKNYRKKIVIFRDDSVPLQIYNFILNSQNKDGGFSSNTSCSKSDPYHSFTALLALCLIDEFVDGAKFSRIDPLFALPA